MIGIHEIKNEIFTLAGELPDELEPTVDVKTVLVRTDEISGSQWRDLRRLYDIASVLYLRFKYGSPGTYVLMGYVGEELVHNQWIVPAETIKTRYPFVTDNCYCIISCMTLPAFRGKRIYPALLQCVMRSGISHYPYTIWTATTNTASLKGILKAGGRKTGEFIQRKGLCGFFHRVEYSGNL